MSETPEPTVDPDELTVVVTGGAGFLGLHTAQKFADKGDVELILVDIDRFRRHEYPDATVFVQADVRDVEVMDELIERRDPDVIIHGAAALPLWEPEDIVDVNLRGTQTVLSAAQKHGVDRFIFISSTAVYGMPEKHPIEEDDPLIGVGKYGETKIEAEKICRTFRAQGMSVPIVRPKTFIGTERLGAFQILYDWIADGNRIPIIGDGANRYQLLEVEDLADALWLAATLDDERANDTFNLGATDFDTIKQDLQAVCDYAGTGAKPLPTPAGPVKAALRAFESAGLSPLYEGVYSTADKHSYVSVERARDRLGWEPEYSNSEALIRSYQWYVDNKDRLEQGTGIKHRIAWDQGILKVFKAIL